MTSFSKDEESGNEIIKIQALPSYFVFNDTLWNVSQSEIYIDSSYFEVDSVQISNQNQSVLVAGEVSRESGSSLGLTFNDLDLSTLNVFTKKLKLDLAGLLSGKANLINAYENPLFLSDLSMEDLYVNGQNFGMGELRAKWDNSRKAIHMLASGTKGGAEILKIEGDYIPESRDLDFEIDFDKIRLSTFEPFAEKLVSDIKGLGSGKISLTGSSNMPQINGDVDLFKASMIINYLQTRYSFTDNISIRNNNIFLENFNLTDEQGNRATADGKITSNYFRELNIGLDINTPEFLFLNTSLADNELFYGKVLASGIIKINGPP
jgi:hypothetical protein